VRQASTVTKHTGVLHAKEVNIKTSKARHNANVAKSLKKQIPTGLLVKTHLGARVFLDVSTCTMNLQTIEKNGDAKHVQREQIVKAGVFLVHVGQQ